MLLLHCTLQTMSASHGISTEGPGCLRCAVTSSMWKGSVAGAWLMVTPPCSTTAQVCSYVPQLPTQRGVRRLTWPQARLAWRLS